MNEDESSLSQKTIRIDETNYNKLSELGKVKDTYNDVIERLISFYECSQHSSVSKMEILKNSVDFGTAGSIEETTLALFDRILKVGDGAINIRLERGKHYTPLREGRINHVIFSKGLKDFCLVDINHNQNHVSINVPAEVSNIALIPGWNGIGSVSNDGDIDHMIEKIQAVYKSL